jgi:hypothetical protein
MDGPRSARMFWRIWYARCELLTCIRPLLGFVADGLDG